MLQNPCKTLGFKKNVVYKIPPGGGKPYPASGLKAVDLVVAHLSLLLTLDFEVLYYFIVLPCSATERVLSILAKT